MEDIAVANVQVAKSEQDVLKCWDVLLALRPHLKPEGFAERILEMFQEGYVLAFIERDGRAASAIGYRYQNYLYNGKHIYIDDLSTLSEYRGQGLAGKLLDYVFVQARQSGLENVTLDSGYQRKHAHRLYLNKGFVLSSHHFEKSLANQ